MADGEINVNVQSDGTQDTLDSIAEQSAEAEEDGGMMAGASGGGGKKGGGALAMLGSIVSKLTLILGAAMFLLQLKPIKELLSGLQRMFSVAIMPLVALLTAFLRPILQRLLRFIGNLDFDNLIEDLLNKLPQFLEDMGNIIANQIAKVLPLIDPAEEGTQGPSLGEKLQTPNPAERRPDLFRQDTGGIPINRNSVANDLLVNLGILSEQSNTTMDRNATETVNRTTTSSGEGGVGE